MDKYIIKYIIHAYLASIIYTLNLTKKNTHHYIIRNAGLSHNAHLVL